MAYTVQIPNFMRRTTVVADDFVRVAVENIHRAPLVFDMQSVEFLYPYGAMLLLSTARHIALQTGYRVRLVNLQAEVGGYLERMDLFEQGEPWLHIKENPKEHFLRSEASVNLVEITRLQSIKQQTEFLQRARSVMETWLRDDPQEIDRIWSVLSEICSNAREHSTDEGQAMVQRYAWPNRTEVHIAVVDLGIGINGSLSRNHEAVASSAEEFILLALRGYSARGAQEGGAGLQMVQERIAQQGGALAIRSDTGFVQIRDAETPAARQLCALPGTQVCVELRSR